MKKFLKYFSVFFFALAVLSACHDDDDPDLYPSELVKGCYVINYGNYPSGGASISKYDYDADQLTNFYYKNQNKGTELLSNIQYAYSYNDQVFLMGNSPDQIISVDPLFVQTKNGVSDQIAKPRACVAKGDYLYISCWGANPDWDLMPNSYIAKYNIVTRTVEKTIPLPGGPEGVEIANGKLYVALNYSAKIGVIDLDSEEVSYIEAPAVSSYFLKDNSGNLYVSMVSTWSDFSAETGLGYINTTTDELEIIYSLPDVSYEYASIMAANSDKSKIYVITSVSDENWQVTSAVSVFDVTTKTFESENLISNISGAKGLTVNPENNQIYLFTGESVTGAGLMKIYSSSGELLDQKTVGASPTMAIFLD
ncbi:DUF5074 domain-containing protein [Gaoshiqia sp. Z1-71]|uniref:DUF5074 domain-containing protein n=1 Tax=Gaoshiqia hydrogeniformans TaxID=3290090 RepID=UPI003BF77BAF